MRPIPASSAPEENEAASPPPMGVQVLSFLAGLLIAGLGFKSAYDDWVLVSKLSHLDRYVETPGRFLEVKVRNDSLGSPEEWYPDVRYEFWVDGKNIWGWRLSYEEEPKPKAYWEQRLSGYAKGAAVPVFYNPREPKDAILEKKHEGVSRTVMKLGLGVLFLLAGLVLAVLPAAAWIRRGFVRK